MKTIGTKLLNIYESVKSVNKDMLIKTRSGGYKVMSEATVINAIRPELLKNKLIIIQTKAHGEKTGNITRVNTQYRIIDTESGEFIELGGYGEGSDSQDKGAGMAQTYALKYVLMKTFMLISGEDADNVSSDQKSDDFQKQLADARKKCLELIKTTEFPETEEEYLKKEIDKNKSNINELRNIYKNILIDIKEKRERTRQGDNFSL